MAELCRCSWEEVWRMTALEWLNLRSYLADKVAFEKERLEQWKRTH